MELLAKNIECDDEFCTRMTSGSRKAALRLSMRGLEHLRSRIVPTAQSGGAPTWAR
jgi:hypothetical protein